MLHLFLLELEPGEELLDDLLLPVLLRLLVVGQTSYPPAAADGVPDAVAVAVAGRGCPPNLLGDLLEGLVVDAASQLAGGQLRSDLFPELHSGAGLGPTGALLVSFCVCVRACAYTAAVLVSGDQNHDQASVTVGCGALVEV